jgi:alpha-beta hydrolase superfamily lysophospholipase
MTAESTLSSFTAIDGGNLVLQDWPLEPTVALRGVIIVVHGLGEHAGRYEPLARQLNTWGFAVRGYDQYGHGESAGKPGTLPSDNRLLDDLADIVDNARARMRARTPLILLGHSMGGLVAARFVSLKIRHVEGLILSSPALELGLRRWQHSMLPVLTKFAPDLSLASGLKPEYLSDDPVVVANYQADCSVHRRLSARLVSFMLSAAKQTLALAVHWKVPTLLLYAGADRLLNPQGSRNFAALAPNSVVTAIEFDSLYHEIFNELNPSPVYSALTIWLDKHF